MSTLYQFLETHRVEKGAEISHTSMGKPKGSFMIRKNEMTKFFELYDKAYINGDDLCIIERHCDYGPLVVDLDFEYLPDVEERQHNEEHVQGIVKLYMEEIVSMFQLEPTDNKLTAFVFEKPVPYKKKEKENGEEGNGSVTGGNKYKCIKDGIHIMFPFIVSTPEPQYIIRDNILTKIGTVLDSLPLIVPKSKEGTNSYTSVVDRSVIQANGWFLFGSTKPKHDKYELQYIFKHNMEMIDGQDYDFNGMTPTRFFSIRNKNETDIVPVKEENLDLIGKFRAQEQKKANKKKSMNATMNQEELNLVKQFVECFSDKRANEYTSWIEVGWALHNIGPDNSDLLDLWIEFSKRSSKYTDGECEKLWENMKDEGLGIGSIRYWAFLDNPDMYKKAIFNDINKMIECSIKTPTNFDIASVLHRMFRYDYKYGPQGTWYYFSNNLWRENNDGMMLRNKISTDLCEKYANMIAEYNKKKLEQPDLTDEDKEDINARVKEILSIISKLRTTSFKDNIMKECKELFYDVDFLSKLDENHYLIGFNNGIFDLKRGELREGRPEDYVTFSTRINKIDFTEEHEQWGELSKFIYTIFPNVEKREYFMTFLASCLQGLNEEERFRIWTGTGCHAKDTRIMMSNGNWKMVQDIIVGDQLMGDDSRPRNVIELKRGFSDMYKIYGNGFKEFIVNGEHVLCLKDENKEIHEIKVIDYITNPTHLKLYKSDNTEYLFAIEKVNNDNYYGFELDGNHRYIMEDNIVTHNSNGKSKLEELFTASFGDYTIKFPITLLTGKRAASNACSPELVKAKGKRIGYFVEPSEGERVNAGLMKEFTGGDKIYARGLNKDPIEFKPQFKLSLLCNDVPHFPPKDEGVWRRVEIIEFTSKFTENPNPENPNEFPIDKQVTEKIQNWKELFMSYLIDVYYVKYKKEGIKVPQEVLKFTKEMKMMFDMYSGFIASVIIETNNPEDVATLSELYEEFKNWYLETFNSPKVPTKHEVRQYFEKTYGKKRVTSTEVIGIKSKMKSEEEKKKKEAEEKALKNKNGEIDDDDENSESSDNNVGVKPPQDFEEFDEEEMNFEDEYDELMDEEENLSKYFGKNGEKKTPPPIRSFNSFNGGNNGFGAPAFKGMNSFPNNGFIQQATNNFFGPNNPFNSGPFVNNNFGNSTVTRTNNNEYNISSMEDLKKLKIPGMENIEENPVLKAIFSRDFEALQNLQHLELKQTGPDTFQLPIVSTPVEESTVTSIDKFGNKTTTNTINRTNNIQTIRFEGLPPGFKGNPFSLLAKRRPPPPPPMIAPHPIMAAFLATILAKKAMEKREAARKRRMENGEPEPEFDEDEDMEINEEKIREMLEEEEDFDIPPDHPLMAAFGSLMKEMIKEEIEADIRSNPNISPEEADKILKEIFSDEENNHPKINDKIEEEIQEVKIEEIKEKEEEVPKKKGRKPKKNQE